TQFSFDSKLISLLPLDDVPVHVHHFAARVPCDSKGSECPGVSVESIQPRPPQPCEVGRPKRAAKEKPTPISQFFLSTCRATRRSESFSPVPRARGHHHSPGTAPEQQCGGANSSLVAAQVLVKPHVAVT